MNFNNVTVIWISYMWAYEGDIDFEKQKHELINGDENHDLYGWYENALDAEISVELLWNSYVIDIYYHITVSIVNIVICIALIYITISSLHHYHFISISVIFQNLKRMGGREKKRTLQTWGKNMHSYTYETWNIIVLGDLYIYTKQLPIFCVHFHNHILMDGYTKNRLTNWQLKEIRTNIWSETEYKNSNSVQHSRV